MSEQQVSVRKPIYQRFLPHRNGLPPMRPYLTELWQRRGFAVELSRANLRSANSDTFFGQLWLIINPLLMAGVYFLLVNIISSRGNQSFGYFTHLVAGLFVFNLVTTAASYGSTSVTTAGNLILNTNFPRLLIPISAVRTAFFRFLPTVPIIVLCEIILTFDTTSPDGLTWTSLLSLVFVAFMIIFGLGLAALFATLQVYFRDTTNFLPFILRIWMYLSPILWTQQQLPEPYRFFAMINPMYPMLTGFADTLQNGIIPEPAIWLSSAIWAVAACILGCLLFISREREFAVRIT